METQDLILDNVYKSLPRKQRLEKRDIITSKCKVSTHIFYNWLKGITPVPHWAQPIIAEILGEPQTELFPEN